MCHNKPLIHVSTLKAFKRKLDNSEPNILGFRFLHWSGVGLERLIGPFQLNYSKVLRVCVLPPSLSSTEHEEMRGFCFHFQLTATKCVICGKILMNTVAHFFGPLLQENVWKINSFWARRYNRAELTRMKKDTSFHHINLTSCPHLPVKWHTFLWAFIL